MIEKRKILYIKLQQDKGLNTDDFKRESTRDIGA